MLLSKVKFCVKLIRAIEVVTAVLSIDTVAEADFFTAL
jgi:hypothetical protein